MNREHIDRSDDVNKFVHNLMNLAEENKLTSAIVRGTYTHNNNHNNNNNNLDYNFDKPFLVRDKLLFVDFIPESEGLIIGIIDQDGKPILSNSFEHIENNNKNNNKEEEIDKIDKNNENNNNSNKKSSFRTENISLFLSGNLKVKIIVIIYFYES